MGKTFIIFKAEMSSFVHIDNKNIETIIDTTLTAEAIYPINFTHPNKRFVFSQTIMEATAPYFLMLCVDFTINNKKKQD